MGLALLLAGCGSSTTDPSTDGPGGDVTYELRSAEARVAVAEGEATAAARAQQEFGFDFLHALPTDENLAFSPHSLSTAFAMVTDAATGKTLAEVEQAFHFGQVGQAFHRSQDALDLALARRNRDAIAEAERKTDAQVLDQSNDLWIRDDAPPEPSYLDTLARFYGIGVHQADFGKQPDAARQAINAKVSVDTRGLIPELLPKDSLSSLTVAVLTNALYFKAPWATKFAAPTPGDFHLLSGETKSVSMMKQESSLAYFEGDGFFTVAIPYYGSELEMMLVVPDVGGLATVSAALSASLLEQVVSARQTELVRLQLPQFAVKSTVPAKKVLKELGVNAAFEARAAEFPKLQSPLFPEVYVSDVLHQATVAIDDVGTEASAATAVVFAGTSSAPPAPPTPRIVTVDRPFIFVIRDNPTGSLLFVGQVVAP